jgi:hypothetical protein
MSASPIEVVGEWLKNLTDPAVINSIVAPDATYISLNTENPELNKIMPWAGTRDVLPLGHRGVQRDDHVRCR